MIRAVASLAAMLVVVLGAAASPAQAAAELGLSPDGQVWSSNLSDPLFDPAVRWVPGDDRYADFYVRNQAADEGTLTLAVETRDPDRLVRAKDIRLSARIGSDAWVDLAAGGRAFRLNDAALPADSVRKVTVRARFDPDSDNRSLRETVALSFRVTLADSDATADPDDEVFDGTGNSDDPDAALDPNDAADLPDTGAPVVGWFIVAAGIAIGAGLALIKRRKREEATHGTAH